jgi:DNA processing protein
VPAEPLGRSAFVTEPDDLDAALVLATLVWMTPRTRIALADRYGSASAIVAAIRRGHAGSAADRDHLALADPDDIRSSLEAAGARAVPIGSADYPGQLESIPDPPLLLFVAGPDAPDPTRCVAIVGSRRCSELGREVATALGRGLAAMGVCVVSGAARGIDAAAHTGAIEGRGGTIAVLGCGIDRPYPSRAFLDRIRAAGSLMTEFPPGTPPHPRHFPCRNRIVAGLCRATVVVEGAEGSGSMITAEHALEFGRDVFAVVGTVTNPLAAVPLRLIREGAGPIRGVDDLLADLDLDGGDAAGRSSVELDDGERRVLEALLGPTLPERAAAAAGLGVLDTVPILMRLELRGLVRSVGGRYEPTLRAASRTT